MGKTKKAGRKIGGVSDLSPAAGDKDVKGGAFNGFANFGDIKGESTDDRHTDLVAVMKTTRPAPTTQVVR
jgi:hypothetical protein